MTTKLFFGGMPTEPDVRKIIAAFPSVEPDQEISYDEIAQIVGVDRDTVKGASRLRTVTVAWRKKMRTLNGWKFKAGNGMLRRVTGKERSDGNVGEWKAGARKIVHAANDMKFVETNGMNDIDRQAHMHRSRVLGANVEDLQKTAKEIAPPSPPKSLPRAVTGK